MSSTISVKTVYENTPVGLRTEHRCIFAGYLLASTASCFYNPTGATLATSNGNESDLTSMVVAETTSATPTTSAPSTMITLLDVTTNEDSAVSSGLLGSSTGSPAACGDGLVQPGEECDPGEGESDECDGDCTQAICGDGYLNNSAGEICDDGNVHSGDVCSASCTEETVIVDIDAGWNHVCVAFATGSLRCWGWDEDGQLGNGIDNQNIGDDPGELPANSVTVGASISATAASYGFTCVLDDDGAVKCWGEGAFGNLGYEDNLSINSPKAYVVDVGLSVVDVVVGHFHACALDKVGLVRCWGLGQQLARGSYDNIGDDPFEMPPSPITGLTAVSQISSGDTHTCAVTISGDVRCWGRNFWGQLGQGNSDDYGDDPGETSPPKVNLPIKAKAVVGGGHHTCALLIDDSVRCWGDNWVGQLGYGHVDSLGDNLGEIEGLTPVAITTGEEKVVEIEAGFNHTCARLNTGEVRCWGQNGNGQLGQGHDENIGDQPGEMPPASSSLGESAMKIAAGYTFTCALLASNSLRCWGYNGYGQLGPGVSIGDGELPSDFPPLPF